MNPALTTILLLSALVALTGVAAWLFAILWRRRDAPAGGTGSPRAVRDGGGLRSSSTRAVCASCHRDYPGEMRFCPMDASPLVATPDVMSLRTRGPTPLLTCPACRRAFEGTVRFCPFDAQELVPLANLHRPAEASGARLTAGGGALAATPAPQPAGPLGEVCPGCGERYPLETRRCPRDGSRLVVLN